MDPMLIKHLIFQAIKDEESRKKVFTVIASIFVAIFLLFTATVYILSSPLKLITNYF